MNPTIASSLGLHKRTRVQVSVAIFGKGIGNFPNLELNYHEIAHFNGV